MFAAWAMPLQRVPVRCSALPITTMSWVPRRILGNRGSGRSGTEFVFRSVRGFSIACSISALSERPGEGALVSASGMWTCQSWPRPSAAGECAASLGSNIGFSPELPNGQFRTKEKHGTLPGSARFSRGRFSIRISWSAPRIDGASGRAPKWFPSTLLGVGGAARTQLCSAVFFRPMARYVGTGIESAELCPPCAATPSNLLAAK